jgi:uncharacterized protein YndB with AHSA1/START domain
MSAHGGHARPTAVVEQGAPPPAGFDAEAAVVRISIAAPAERVWSVLSDGFTYPAWVVGASHMRAVDRGWPQVGSRLHHSVGAWPVLVHDSTEVESLEDGRSLVLLAHGRPIGDARVRFDLEPDPDGRCTVHMTEDAISATARRLLPGRVRAGLISARNRETLARLAVVCERRDLP